MWANRRVFSNSRMNRAAIGLLADARPVTPEALAAATGEPVAQARAHIESAAGLGYEVEDGTVVGAALTLRPTRHRFRVRAHDLYTPICLSAE